MSYNITDILVATKNPGKITELKACLGYGFKWLSLSDLEEIIEVNEDCSTFEENARKKASGYAKATGFWTIADDSGLVVDALDGAPGVISARFSGEKTKNKDHSLIDHRNITKVLELLQGVPTEKRTARFVCSLCLASPKKILLETQGTLEGRITDHEIGTNGFGYDPIFYVPELKKTVAQLSADQKNDISHRGKAIQKLKYLLEKLIQTKQGGQQ